MKKIIEHIGGKRFRIICMYMHVEHRVFTFAFKFRYICILKYNIGEFHVARHTKRQWPARFSRITRSSLFFFHIPLNCDKVPFAIFNGRKCPCVNFTVRPFDISRYFSSPAPIAGFHAHGSMHIAFGVPVDFCAANIKKNVFPVMRDSKRITRGTYVRNICFIDHGHMERVVASVRCTNRSKRV